MFEIILQKKKKELRFIQETVHYFSRFFSNILWINVSYLRIEPIRRKGKIKNHHRFIQEHRDNHSKKRK
jgi:hypothetical protein